MSWLSVWVGFCERHATPVLILTTLLTVIAAGISWRYSSIDSDLNKLIKPSDALGWYRDDVAYKAAFPQSQQTALIVVSGKDGAVVEAVGADLVEALEKYRAGVRGTNSGDIAGMRMRPMSMILPDEQAMKDVIAYIMTLDQ